MAFAAALALFAVPGVAVAQDPAGGTAAPTPEAPNADGAAGEMPLEMPAHVMRRHRVRINGHSRKAKKRVVRVERRTPGGPWIPIGRARATKRGNWTLLWKPSATGAFELRARLGNSTPSGNGGTSAGGLEAEVGSAGSRYVTVFEPAMATWYGPGFFGNQTACGGELARDTVGVAHRDLPCGTQVQISYGGRSIVVPVIDRGPFANNADWDLTQAAAQQLGMTATSRIGFIVMNPGG